MKLTVRRVLVAGGVAAALMIALVALLWPSAPAPEKVAQRDVPPTERPKPKRGTVPSPSLVEDRKEGDILERLGIDPEITPHCAVINQWHDRHVPQWVILDNMDAGGMVFHQEELDCLTTSPLPPAFLTWAENHIDHRTNALLAE